MTLSDFKKLSVNKQARLRSRFLAGASNAAGLIRQAVKEFGKTCARQYFEVYEKEFGEWLATQSVESAR